MPFGFPGTARSSIPPQVQPCLLTFESDMKRRIWTAVIGTVMTTILGTVPVYAAASSSTDTAAAAEDDPVDPPLYDSTADGGTVRVNVVTEDRADLPSAAAVGQTVLAFDKLPVVTLKVDRDGLDELASQPGVVSVTEDVPAPPALDESVPHIGGDLAIEAGKTGKGSAIAILDTGVATSHPFLKDRVIGEACFSPADAAYSASSLCPDGTSAQEGSGSGDSARGACAAIAGCDHGTHVAGIAAGNGAGIAGAPASGVAPGADIIAIQVFSRFDSEQYCGAGATPCVRSFTSAQIAGLEKVLAMRQAGTPVIAANLSLGAASYKTACTKDARKSVIDSLFDAGVATVVAAGNNGLEDAVNAPACVPSAVAVGSTTDDDEVSSFSNRGPLLDVFAPGTGIVSSVHGGYDSKSGTSMAAPHVAGAFAVLRQAFPDKTLAELESLLKTTGTVITDEGVGTPRIDIGKAIGAVAPEPEPEPEPVPDPKPRPSEIVNDTDYAIPDPGSVQSPITVAGIPGNASEALRVYVDVGHDWRGEVKIDLIDPNGRSYLLKPTDGTQNGGAITTTYTVDASASPASGTWKLQVEDESPGATGTLRNWSMAFPSFARTGTFAIPDPGTLTSDITVDGISGAASGALQLHVDVTHEWLGDLKIDLVDPNGKSYLVKSTSDVDGTLDHLYTVDAAASPAAGTWKLRIQDNSQGASGTLHGWSLTFPSFENQTHLAIPDSTAVQSPTTVGGIPGNAPKALRVHVSATHEWRGDLQIDLVGPDGRSYSLKSPSDTQNGGTVSTTYTIDAGASPASGTWQLRVEDVSDGATGTLTDWSLTF
ncbi:proprotein convertase P-domain-containing protein [Streptomyces sp. Act-28]